jgi:hypothetical protein
MNISMLEGCTHGVKWKVAQKSFLKGYYNAYKSMHRNDLRHYSHHRPWRGESAFKKLLAATQRPYVMFSTLMQNRELINN